MKLWFDKVIKIQCLETFEVMIIINDKTLKYSPGIAPEELSERCEMCEITGWTWFAQADDALWYLTHFQCLFFHLLLSSFSYFTTSG